MTVKELIKELQKKNPDAKVKISLTYWDESSQEEYEEDKDIIAVGEEYHNEIYLIDL